MLDRRNRERIDMQLDQVPTHDEVMAAGQPGVHSESLDALAERADVTVEAQPAETIDLSGTPLGDQIRELLEAQGVIAEGESAARATTDNPVERRIAQLERLRRLREAGVLSEQEFEAQKAAILREG